MATGTTTISGLTNNTQKTINSKAILSRDFDDFLRLLTTQLKNQDPLNPMDSNEFTNQLVQFSQVEQQINTNQKLDSLTSLQLSTSISAALGYVGLDASYVSNEMNYDGSTPVKVTYSLANASTRTTFRVFNAQGNEVSHRSVPGNTGKNELTWDGKDDLGNSLPTGTYTIRIDALDQNDKAVTSTVVVEGRVRGVETQDGQILLLVGERAVPVANVLNAALPLNRNSNS